MATDGGELPFARTLFEACDRLRGHVESAEYKHLVLGLLFLKYVSESFQRRRDALEAETRRPDSDVYTEDEGERAEVLEDRDEYTAENVFWVPPDARWPRLLAHATQADLGPTIDAALEAVERENPELRGVLPRIYARAPISPEKLGELLNTIGKVGFGGSDEEARDVLGRTYEYFIKTFARSEGHRGGEFYTPNSVTRLLVEMLEPFSGRVYDPACGSGGLFVQSGRFVEAHGGRTRDVAIYGQENNQATWRIGRMNLAIHGLAGDLQLGDTLLDPKHRDLRADTVLANPPFNMKKWGAASVAGDVRWKYGAPPDGNANYAWIQHFIHHLAPNGRAGFVMANGSLSGGGAEGRIREAIVRDDLVDCIVALPAQLFFTTGIPVCLWFLDREKRSSRCRDRTGETLFIDARTMGVKVNRTQIELTDDDVSRIASTYHRWRGQNGWSHAPYADEPGFSRGAPIEEVEGNGFVLTPGRYVGTAEGEPHEGESHAEAVERLTRELDALFAAEHRLEATIRANLRSIADG